MFYPVLDNDDATGVIRYWGDYESPGKFGGVKGSVRHGGTPSVAFPTLKQAVEFVEHSRAMSLESYAGVIEDATEYEVDLGGLCWRVGDPIPGGGAPRVWRLLMGKR